MSAQLSNLSCAMDQALKTNQDVAAKFLTGQHRELQQIARSRQDMKQIEPRLRQPDQLISGAVGDQGKEYKARTEKGRKEQPYSRYITSKVAAGHWGVESDSSRGKTREGDGIMRSASVKGAMVTRTIDAVPGATGRKNAREAKDGRGATIARQGNEFRKYNGYFPAFSLRFPGGLSCE